MTIWKWNLDCLVNVRLWLLKYKILSHSFRLTLWSFHLIDNSNELEALGLQIMQRSCCGVQFEILRGPPNLFYTPLDKTCICGNTSYKDTPLFPLLFQFASTSIALKDNEGNKQNPLSSLIILLRPFPHAPQKVDNRNNQAFSYEWVCFFITSKFHCQWQHSSLLKLRRIGIMP